MLTYAFARVGLFGRAAHRIHSSDYDDWNEGFVFLQNYGIFHTAVTTEHSTHGYYRGSQTTYYIRPVDLYVDDRRIRNETWDSVPNSPKNLTKDGRL